MIMKMILLFNGLHEKCQEHNIQSHPWSRVPMCTSLSVWGRHLVKTLGRDCSWHLLGEGRVLLRILQYRTAPQQTVA